MIAALLGLLLPIAGVFYALGLFHGARDAHDEQANAPVSFADVLAEGRVNQAATDARPHSAEAFRQNIGSMVRFGWQCIDCDVEELISNAYPQHVQIARAEQLAAHHIASRGSVVAEAVQS